jgi:hypothetical protein
MHPELGRSIVMGEGRPAAKCVNIGIVFEVRKL